MPGKIRLSKKRSFENPVRVLARSHPVILNACSVLLKVRFEFCFVISLPVRYCYPYGDDGAFGLQGLVLRGHLLSPFDLEFHCSTLQLT